MSVVSNSPAVLVGEPNDAVATRRTLAPFVVFAAVIFNFVLCFVDTKLFSIRTSVVIACEAVLIATAFGLIWYRGTVLYLILSILAAYFFALMLFRFDFDPKILRDLLIPFIFFFLGIHYGSLRECDRLVTLLIVIAFGAALFEWLALDTYLHYFNVMHYYVARGTSTLQTDAVGLSISSSDGAGSLFASGTRFEERTLLPFLGSHRASGIFLEPVSLGNFGAIAFAWILLRRWHSVGGLVAQLVAIGTILVLADDRFGFYLCILTLGIYLAAGIIRPTMLFVAPFLAMTALAIYAGASWQELSYNTIAGRLLGAGNSLLNLNLLAVLGLQASDQFGGYAGGDSGYSYVLLKIGLVGSAAIWALFIYAPVFDRNAWRFKNFIAFYAVLLLSISASMFTIKTAALLWYLYGTLNNPERRPAGT